MSLDHYLAVRALIPDNPGFGVHFGDVQKVTQYPYVVVWGDLGTEVSESVADQIDQLDLRPRVTYVGTGFEQCLWVAGLVRTALNHAVPVVAGWGSSKLRQQALLPVTTDWDVTLTNGSHPVYAVDEYPFTSFLK